MIYLLTTNRNFNRKLQDRFENLGLEFTFVKFTQLKTLEVIYREKEMIEALIVDSHYSKVLPDGSWIDLLEGLGRRFPILVVSDEDKFSISGQTGHGAHITWLKKPDVDEVINFLKTSSLIDNSRKQYNNSIPIYNPMLSSHVIQMNGYLSMILIDASKFRKIAIEYGGEVYAKLQICFQKILIQLWGAKGSFRSSDILCRLNPDSNIFLILLEQSRMGHHIPLPGDLERLSDRLTAQIENLLWAEIFKPKNERILPSFFTPYAEIFSRIQYSVIQSLHCEYGDC